jgi:hypothetical protein
MVPKKFDLMETKCLILSFQFRSLILQQMFNKKNTITLKFFEESILN